MDDRHIYSLTHLAAVLGRHQEVEDTVDQVRVGSLLLQVQNCADQLQLGVGELRGSEGEKEKVSTVRSGNREEVVGDL